MHSPHIYPSLMSANLLNLAAVIRTLEPHCSGFHIDIMDNHFVPNLTWGAHLTNQIANVAVKPLLVHLMVTNPLSIIDKLKLTHGSVISYHLEATDDHTAVCDTISTFGYIPSIAIKPSTPLERLFPLLEAGITHVLLMSVEPGFSGQKFIDSSYERLNQLVAFTKTLEQAVTLCMDGGINEHNIGRLHADGAQQFAVSSALFDQPDMLHALKELYAKAR